MALTIEQARQVKKQLKAHEHKNYKVNIELTEGDVLKNFIVHSNVLRPEKMTALYLAKWLFFNNGIYKNKVVIEIGSGTGIQGIVAGLYGAKKVILSDLSHAAVVNSEANVKQFKLQEKVVVFEGDLFEKVKAKADVIIFNHPFFSDGTLEQLRASSAMLERGKLIHTFFDQAKDHLYKNGVIIMPYYHIAGPINDPAKQAIRHGLTVAERFRLSVKNGLQKGDISVYEIRIKE